MWLPHAAATRLTLPRGRPGSVIPYPADPRGGSLSAVGLMSWM
jgi:hypothetical protein